ncbi:DNA-deoxyinosine glycosylase [Dechloromonas sp. ARDL1]|uniref:DNA-deoxyinosine glycosylase n=1 Tax=Dechloromonas sp. ARDL1 TaxID=3322121 RepID=UPI003DA70979
MAAVRSFAPVVSEGASVLILGSMPGEASLRAGQYYAHERNAFWRIMGDLLGAGPSLSYRERLDRISAAGIALWDVIADCERNGSLDADIVGASVHVNDFAWFFAAYPGVRRVYFNGAAAETHFRRHVLPKLSGLNIRLVRLPSTSPAHAAKGYSEKLAAWSSIVAG